MDPNGLASQPPYYGAIGICGSAIWLATRAVQVVFEDVVLKLTGILFWSAFLVRLALASLAPDRRRLPSRR